jgi:hypothetical protein
MARPRVQWAAAIFLALTTILAFFYVFDSIDLENDGQGGHRCVS